MSQSDHESLQIGELDLTTTIIIRLNKGFQSIRDTPIKVHSKPKHFRLSYLNEKLQKSVGCLKRSFAAAVGVEESSLTVGNE